MYDPTFGSVPLARQLRKLDFSKQPALRNPVFKEAMVERAVNVAREGFTSLPLDSADRAGRRIYQVNDLASDLVLRKAAQNLRRITGAKQSSRIEIVRRLKLLCEEGLPFAVAKMDIKGFYPSIDQQALLGLIGRRLLTAPSTRTVLKSFITQCNAHAVSGLPPGLAVSAELSEFYMQNFDFEMRGNLTAHYFARYVDDIVIVMPPADSVKAIKKKIEGALPDGLRLNHTKSRVYNFGGNKSSKPSVEHSFEYLGFRFNVFQPSKERPHVRKVELDIATSKVKRSKTRIVRSLLRYLADGNFEDLRDRVRILTCGYQFFDERRQSRQSAGLQHTYSLIESDAPGLVELDRFLQAMVLSDVGPICGRLRLCLSGHQKKQILSHSFYTGFENKVNFRFSADRLAHLVECWKYA